MEAASLTKAGTGDAKTHVRYLGIDAAFACGTAFHPLLLHEDVPRHGEIDPNIEMA